MRFFDLTLATAAANVAMDEALCIAAENGEIGPVVRVWELDQTAVVLGASGRIENDVNINACRADGVAVARRSSGGGTVLIGPGCLSFAVVLAIDSDPRLASVDSAQAYVLETTAASLRAAGDDVRVLGSGDLTLDGKKFSGSAQRRLKRFAMIHASVLYDFDLALVARYLKQPAKQPSYREGRSHDAFLTQLPRPRAEIVGAIRRAWRADDELVDPPLEIAAARLEEKFGKAEWIERM